LIYESIKIKFIIQWKPLVVSHRNEIFGAFHQSWKKIWALLATWDGGRIPSAKMGANRCLFSAILCKEHIWSASPSWSRIGHDINQNLIVLVGNFFRGKLSCPFYLGTDHFHRRNVFLSMCFVTPKSGVLVKWLNVWNAWINVWWSGSQNEAHKITSVLRERVKSDFSSTAKSNFWCVCYVLATN